MSQVWGGPKQTYCWAEMNGHFAFNVFIAVVKNTVVKLSMNACGDNKNSLLGKIIKTLHFVGKSQK